MEEESSRATSVQAEIPGENHNEENTESRSVQAPKDTNRNDSGVCDGEILEDQCNGIAETSAQEATITTAIQGNEDYLPETRLSAGEDMSPPSASSHSPAAQNIPSEPCWYCLRSLDPESHPNGPKQKDDSEPESPLSSSGQKVNYQMDPRPHFGVACSSHSTCSPLWGSEGALLGAKESGDARSHRHLPALPFGLAPDTLRWHEAKCLLFDGLRSSQKEN